MLPLLQFRDPNFTQEKLHQMILEQAAKKARNAGENAIAERISRVQGAYVNSRSESPNRISYERDPIALVTSQGDYSRLHHLPESFEPVPERHRRIDPLSLHFNQPQLPLETPLGTINYYRLGNPEGLSVLYLPGVPDQAYTFHRCGLRLANRCDVLAYEPPIKGWSRPADQFDASLDAYAYSLLMFMQKMDLKEVTLVAHSSAVPEVLHALLTYGPERLGIRRLVVTNGWAPAILPDVIPLDVMERLSASDALGETLFALNQATDAKEVEALIRGEIIRKVNTRDSTYNFEFLVQQYMRIWRDPRGYTPQKAWLTARTEGALVEHARAHAQFHERNLSKLQGLEVVVIASTHDQMVIGAQDHLSPQVKEMMRNVRNLGGFYMEASDTKDHLLYTDENGEGLPHRLARGFEEITKRKVPVRIIQNVGHLAPLEASEEIAEIIDATLFGEPLDFSPPPG